MDDFLEHSLLYLIASEELDATGSLLRNDSETDEAVEDPLGNGGAIEDDEILHLASVGVADFGDGGSEFADGEGQHFALHVDHVVVVFDIARNQLLLDHPVNH